MEPTTGNPTVAIMIAAYNAQETIARAIRSALAEPQVTQVIVVDDASRDATTATAQACDDGSGRLLVLSQPVNAGPAAARNRALEQCTAEWIGPLDADDFFLPGRIAALLAHASDADMLADDMWQVGENDIDGLRTPLLGAALPDPLMVDFSHFVASNTNCGKRQRGELGFIKPLMRTQFLRTHQVHYQPHMRLGEDFELYARMLGLGARLIIIPERGYMSVVRANSLSGQHSEADLKNLRDCHIALRESLALTRAQAKVLERHRKSVDARLQWRLMILAVKHKDIKAALACFHSPFSVNWFVAKQLFEQCLVRGFKRGVHA